MSDDNPAGDLTHRILRDIQRELADMRQVPIGRYIADFVCHEARLIVEIDGGQHDRSSPRETERSGFLQSQGYRIVRFWNDEVLTNPDGVHQTIVNELAASPPLHPPPSSRAIAFEPSPSMGEGWEGVIVPEDNPSGTAGGEFTPTPPSLIKGEGFSPTHRHTATPPHRHTIKHEVEP